MKKITTKKPVAKKTSIKKKLTSKKPVTKKITTKKPVAKKTSTKKKLTAKKPATKKITASKKAVKKSVKTPLQKKGSKTLKKVVKKTKTTKKPVVKATKKDQIIWATGKRKTSIARVMLLTNGNGEIYINSKPYKTYFNILELRNKVFAPIELLKQANNFQFRIKVHGGGQTGQADAACLGISRALIKFNLKWRAELKKAGFLRRDARKKERKKPGLKRARRAPQWRKR